MARRDQLTRRGSDHLLSLRRSFAGGGKAAQRDDGFIVVAVLWILAILAALISVYAIYVAKAAVSLSVNDDRVQAEALISAALELTAYQLTAVDEQARPTHGDFTFRMGRANAAVQFRSEAARIDLNAAPKELLTGLFTTIGAGYDSAEKYATRIIGWRSKAASDDLAGEAAAYRTAGLSYAPRQAPFASVSELWLVLGLPPALVARALPFVTVYSGLPTVNVEDAPPEVIAALPGMSADLLYAVLSRRGSGPQNPQFIMGMLGQAQSAATIEGSKAMRVIVHIGFDNGRHVGAEAVILPLRDAAEPFRVLYWRDDFDGPG